MLLEMATNKMVSEGGEGGEGGEWGGGEWTNGAKIGVRCTVKYLWVTF